MGVRRRARECALQMLYQCEAQVQAERARDRGPGSLEGIATTVDTVIDGFAENFEAPGNVQQYAARLVRGVAAHHHDIDERIRSHSPNWKLERMAMVDRNVLRLAIFEMMHENQVPNKVVINEGIEIARRFGSEKSSAFVNGVLGSIHKNSAG